MDLSFLNSMFVLSVPVVEKVLRVLFVYTFLVVGLRLAGKRELAQLNTFDLVVLLTLSNTVQNAIIGNDNTVTGGIIGAATLLLVNYLVVRFLYEHERIDRWVEGSEDKLILNGKVLRKNLGRELITLAELEIAAHRQGYSTLAEIKEATLEPGGTVVFVPQDPSPEVARYRELLKRLDRIENELASLRLSRPGGAE